MGSSMLSKLKSYKDLRSQAKTVQNVMSQESAHGAGAGKLVNVVMDGNQKIMSIDIADELLNVEHKEKLQKGIIEAIETATKQIQKIIAKKIQSGDMEMPDLSGLR